MPRKIVANLFLTLDGVMESPEQWQFPYFNDEMGAAIGAGFAASDALLMGGTLYREWAAHWPAQSGDVADIMNTTAKYVVTRTLDTADWANTTVLRGDDVAAQVRELTQREGKDIVVSGSATLVNWLLSEQLLDELSLLVCPLLRGHGRRLFDPAATPHQPLELVSGTAFATGVLHQTYRPAAS